LGSFCLSSEEGGQLEEGREAKGRTARTYEGQRKVKCRSSDKKRDPTKVEGGGRP